MKLLEKYQKLLGRRYNELSTEEKEWVGQLQNNDDRELVDGKHYLLDATNIDLTCSAVYNKENNEFTNFSEFYISSGPDLLYLLENYENELKNLEDYTTWMKNEQLDYSKEIDETKTEIQKLKEKLADYGIDSL